MEACCKHCGATGNFYRNVTVTGDAWVDAELSADEAEKRDLEDLAEEAEPVDPIARYQKHPPKEQEKLDV